MEAAWSASTQLALAFVTSRPFATSNIIGATTLAQLEEDLGARRDPDALHQLHGNPAP